MLGLDLYPHPSKSSTEELKYLRGASLVARYKFLDPLSEFGSGFLKHKSGTILERTWESLVHDKLVGGEELIIHLPYCGQLGYPEYVP